MNEILFLLVISVIVTFYSAIRGVFILKSFKMNIFFSKIGEEEKEIL